MRNIVKIAGNLLEAYLTYFGRLCLVLCYVLWACNIYSFIAKKFAKLIKN